MKDKPIREKIRIPVYWLEMYRFLKPESIGKLIDAVCLYVTDWRTEGGLNNGVVRVYLPR
jgi:hypothetical protein